MPWSKALWACGLEPKRVDKHNEGRLLKSEIVRFIEDADIIVADLTNERPNCYLEIGYAMGLDKFSRLILTVRDDHFAGNSRHKPEGPKIHFDLAGYDILPWHPDRLADFGTELEKRINRRLALQSKNAGSPSEDDQEWLTQNRVRATEGILSMKFQAYMELHFGLLKSLTPKSPEELLNAARSAQVRAFSSPIGLVLDKKPPRPTTQGIIAEIRNDGMLIPRSYYYWSLRRNGTFYQLHSLFEDQSGQGVMFFDTRIMRVTGTLLYCRRLYDRLGVEPDAWVRMTIKHCGFKDRLLSAADPTRTSLGNFSALENEVEQTQSFKLSAVETELTQLVKGFLAPLFELFNYCKFDDTVYGDIINEFVKRASGR